MREIHNHNLAAGEPLTPLHADEAVRYVRCNLTNRLVHPDSVLDHCQTVQIVFAGDESAVVGFGATGEVTAGQVEAVCDAMGVNP